MKSKIELIWAESLGSEKLSLKNYDEMYIVILYIFNEFHGQQKQKRAIHFLQTCFYSQCRVQQSFLGAFFSEGRNCCAAGESGGGAVSPPQWGPGEKPQKNVAILNFE